MSVTNSPVSVRPTNAVRRFRCPTCGAKRGNRCLGGRIHMARRTKEVAHKS